MTLLLSTYLLDWRNTPTEGVGTSPAQRFLGRRCKTLLPMTHLQLEPQYPTASDARALLDQRAKQQQYYNRSAKDLPPISRGDTIRMQLPGQTKWTPGVCTGQHGPRSYNVRVDDREFRRNRRQLLYTKEARPLEPPNMDPNVETPTASDGTVGPAEQMPDTQMPLELGVSPRNGSVESTFGTIEGSVVFYRCHQYPFPEELMRAVCTVNGWSPNPAELVCNVGMLQ